MGGNKVKVKVYKGLNIIFSIQFKKIEFLIDCESCVFLGSIKNNEAKINKNVTNKLLKKFNKDNWDVFENDLVHIKFLIEYSPILSKFVDPSEFDNIEFINLCSNVNNTWKDAYYVDFGENVKFFKVSDVLYEERIFSIDITPEFLKVLESWGEIK